jgi:hypothetical protein
MPDAKHWQQGTKTMSDFISAAEYLASIDAKDDQLLDALLATFGSKPFDTTSVVLAAAHNEQLATAIDIAVAHARYKQGRFKHHPIAQALKRIARQHFDTDPCGYWLLRHPAKEPTA